MKVLVAIDNKPSSQAIIDAMVKMRWYEATEISLLTVLPPGVEYGTGEQTSPTTADEIESLVVELHNALPQCEVSFFARHGDAKTVILEFSEQIQADLIVLGSNCKNTMERLLIGSVCQEVLNSAHCPVIVAKAPCTLAQEAAAGFKTILLPVDSSIFTDAALRWLANFRWSADTRFIVGAAVEALTDLEEVRISLTKRAFDLSKLLNTNNVMIEAVTGEPRDAIVAMAIKHSADLVVMGSHGRTGIKKLILGSVSQAVSHSAPCAVAIVRGIAAHDDTWLRTGAFQKMKTTFGPDTVAPSSRADEGRGDMSVHVMPGGM